MNIALLGYGKMGREIERLARERKITVKKIFDVAENPDGKGLTKQSLKGVDVCIDFSTPDAALTNIKAVADCGVNIVVGTTGWYGKLKQVEALVRAKKIGLLYSPNFSIGMNVFIGLVVEASARFDKIKEYDVAIAETHHKGKVDSPSGTALIIGEAILSQINRKKKLLLETSHDQIPKESLHVTSTRVGSVVGTHEVLFDSEADSIELVHTAKNRSGFALGALVGAEWLKGKKGCFTMRDVINSL
ncbi:MAG TPA: 4-hydroxy-tetrahydrodipicolinate reductase [Bacteroidota bacterium]|jgi:4-hydroxy-tetrahydrodipicolinate reductase